MIPSIALLNGGHATRLYPLTHKIPKAMVEVAGKPFIVHQLDLLKKNGIKHVVICSGHLGEQIESFIGNGKQFGISVSYSNDGEKKLGTGGAIKKALPLLEDPFFVMYGDSYLDIDFKMVCEYFLKLNGQGVMTVIKNQDKWDSSNVVFKDGHVVHYNKKEKIETMHYIDYGLSLFRKSVFDEWANSGCFDLEELYQKLISRNKLLGYEAKNRFYEIGSVQGLAETKAHFLNSNK